MLSNAKMYARFATGLRGFLRKRITLEDARAILRKRMQEREANFIRVLERGVFGHPGSPYLPLLSLAGCELGDIKSMVRAKGLEATLWSLREQGVYVSFEEFKGREPLVRHGKEIPLGPRAFDNPYTKICYAGESGGTTGAGTRNPHDLERIVARAPVTLLAQEAQGTLGLPRALWRGILPNTVGINNILGGAIMGNIPERWFSPTTSRDRKTALKFRVANHFIVNVGRLHGLPFPRPERVPLDEAIKVARWIHEKVRDGGRCFLSTSAGMAVRVSLAAQAEGLDLTHAVILGSGEPPTPAKVRTIEESGAKHTTNYYCSGVGAIGLKCANPVDSNDQHFVQDHLAMVQYPRTVPGTEIEVKAFNFTSLSPAATTLLLNVEIDDYGIVEKRACGCPLEEYGFDVHIREIRSFRKLTGEGITLIGSEMEHILDTVLPSRFGGSPIDYQLHEEEDQHGLTRLSLVISPHVPIADEQVVVDTVLDCLARKGSLEDGARAIWKQARSIRVKRMEPVWTARGKLNPLHLVKCAGSTERSPAEPTRMS